jgi:hypothetical protein
MTEERVYYTATDPRSVLRIGVGLVVLLALVLASALLGWLMAGFPTISSPPHWWNRLDEFAHLAFMGAGVGIVGLGCLWFVGLLAFAIGDVAIAKWRTSKIQERTMSTTSPR